jgi:hypothetical protein
MKIINLQKGKLLEWVIALIFVGIGISFRLLPHLANFTPVAAIALFGGVYLPKKLALVLPLAAMIISDLIIGLYDQKLMFFVYGSFVLCVLLGFWLKGRKKWTNILGTSIAGSSLFFLITNFAVWSFSAWYPKTLSGIIQCYTMALPFFRNTLFGDLFYVFFFFGIYEAAIFLVLRKDRNSIKILSE